MARTASTRAALRNVSHRQGPKEPKEPRRAEKRPLTAAIVDLIESKGGVMTLEDLANTDADVVQAIKYDYKASGDEPGLSLWEVRLLSYGVLAVELEY